MTNLRFRRSAVLAVAATVCVSGWGLVAQSPPDAPLSQPAPSQPTELVVPDQPLPPRGPAPDDPVLRERIERALDGDPDATSGNPLQSDVLDLIRRRGSLLKGSILDPDSDSDQDFRGGPRPVANQPTGELSSQQQNQFYAAEMLLKTARLLGKLNSDDDQTQQLASQMRGQAARLLADALSADELTANRLPADAGRADSRP
ncbi:hypothetical protein NHH03_03905 [Stieleria sp. TO1_6]|uniref:hypothetical protein n=1 Tax=Stieleria tagensis TaxID=2956795 RepID=UPI00209ACE85|nr:hypothetical protein [Stieleria tagensis]MCO8120869.1 hypothetical protein [Stieleria tagensis]